MGERTLPKVRFEQRMGALDRYYTAVANLPELLGIDATVTEYGTVTSATRNGEPMSTAHAYVVGHLSVRVDADNGAHIDVKPYAPLPPGLTLAGICETVERALRAD